MLNLPRTMERPQPPAWLRDACPRPSRGTHQHILSSRLLPPPLILLILLNSPTPAMLLHPAPPWREDRGQSFRRGWAAAAAAENPWRAAARATDDAGRPPRAATSFARVDPWPAAATSSVARLASWPAAAALPPQLTAAPLPPRLPAAPLHP
jgi:hypothetical protein